MEITHTKYVGGVNRDSFLREIPVERVKEEIVKRLDAEYPEGYNILRREEEESHGVIGVKAFIDK